MQHVAPIENSILLELKVTKIVAGILDIMENQSCTEILGDSDDHIEY